MASSPYLCTPPAYVFEVFSHGGWSETLPHFLVSYYELPTGYRLVVHGDDGSERSMDCTDASTVRFLEWFLGVARRIAAA